MDAVANEPIPDRIGRHQVIAKLAAGGMAAVYLARLVGPGGFENLVVIKRMLPHLGNEPRFRGMFVDEARTVARIRHANVVRTFELVADDGDPYLVMEYLEGETVAELDYQLRLAKAPLRPALVAHIVAEAAAGLHAAHELRDEDGLALLGLVHRDVSPQNLYVTYDGDVKLIDFGIAKSADQSHRTEPGEIRGKLAYMAPEQASGTKPDRRVDVFALGVVLWELLTGRRLFRRKTPLLTLRAVRDEVAPPPSTLAPEVPAELDAVCARSLEKDPERRYATIAEMRRDLLRALSNTTRGEDLRAELASAIGAACSESRTRRRELLRKVREFDGTRYPEVTADLLVELSNSFQGLSAVLEPEDDARFVQALSAKPRVRLWTQWAEWAAATLVVAGACGAAWVLLRDPGSPSPRPTVVPASELPTRPTSPAPEPRPEPPALPASTRVRLAIQSVPDGALVTIAGITRGNTPLTLEVERSAEPTEVRLVGPGGETLDARVVPDSDHEFVFTLPRPRPRATPASPSSMRPTAMEEGGFFAFQ